MGIILERMYVGTLFTSLDMNGVQISIMKVTEENKAWISCLDDPTDAPAWPGRVISHEKSKFLFQEINLNRIIYTGSNHSQEERDIFKLCVEKAALKMIEVEAILNEINRGSKTGFGNTGTSFRKLATGILIELDGLPFAWPRACLLKLANIASDVMGGISGGLYSIMFKAASLDAPNWPQALDKAISTVMQYTSAKQGDGTFLDALIPASEQLLKHHPGEEWSFYLMEALTKANEGYEETIHDRVQSTRYSFAENHILDDESYSDIISKKSDAGAFAVVCWLEAVVEAIRSKNDL